MITAVSFFDPRVLNLIGMIPDESELRIFRGNSSQIDRRDSTYQRRDYLNFPGESAVSFFIDDHMKFKFPVQFYLSPSSHYVHLPL